MLLKVINYTTDGDTEDINFRKISTNKIPYIF